MKICAIHQPNFFPWLRFFDKIRRSDVFVFLDDAQIQKTAGSWTNRVKIIIGKEARWFTAPIARKKGTQIINEVIFNKINWREKLKKTLQAEYARCEYFKRYKNFVFELIDNSDENLASYNVNAIWKICDFFGIDFLGKVQFSSSLNIRSIGTQRLIDITKAVKCDAYLSGGMGKDYMDEDLFSKNKIALIYQDYVPINKLSVINYIFAMGSEL